MRFGLQQLGKRRESQAPRPRWLKEDRNVWEPFTVKSLPGVQVIIATYNVRPYIERCLESVENALRGFRWVLLIGDDESTDETAAWLREFQSSNFKFQIEGRETAVSAERVVIRQFQKAPNVSIAKDRVLTMGREFRAEFPALCFMDGDDEMGVDRVRHLLPAAVAGGHQCVHGDWIGLKGNAQEYHSAKTEHLRIGGPWVSLMHHSVVPPNDRLFLGILPAREDLVCWEQLHHRGVTLTPVPGAVVHHYHMRGDSVSQWGNADFRTEIRARADELIQVIRRRPRLGLSGYNTAQGLGYMNRDLVEQIPFDHWFVIPHDRLPALPPCGGAIVRDARTCSMEAFVSRLDWLVFCQGPIVDELPALAAKLGVKVACIPMWEYLREDLPWLRTVDLFICPTLNCFQMLQRWARQLNLKARIEYVPWPIEVNRFQFRLRTICERFVSFIGIGGAHSKLANGTSAGPRKGLDIVFAAARLAPEIPIVVQLHPDYAREIVNQPRNVEIITGGDDNTDLYQQGDVAIQPSRYEGLGLQSLEAQACGLPMIVTNAAPMNELNPLDTLEARALTVKLAGRFITAHEVSPQDLANAMRWWRGRSVAAQSLAARRWVETERSWEVQGRRIAELLGMAELKAAPTGNA